VFSGRKKNPYEEYRKAIKYNRIENKKRKFVGFKKPCLFPQAA
jgi:hypothetical protein